jgi:outer membrane protein, multidrug efflux system
VGRRHSACVALLALALAACRVGPNYIAPKSEVPNHFSEAPAGSVSRLPTGEWWRALGDSELDDLVADALEASPDLAAARARVLEARAERAAVAGERLPELSATAAYARQHGSLNVPIGTPPGGLGPDLNSNLYLAGFDAGWELDFFGGTRRAVESADATLQAVSADRDDAQLTLTAEIARDYIELRTEQRRLAIASETLAVRRDELALVRALLESGLAAALDEMRARADAADSEAEVARLEAAERAALYSLGVLIGKPPETLVSRVGAARPIPAVEGDVPVGLPSDLLRRRPDIRAAERRIAAANARIGLREADLYPHFSLTGVAGFESLYGNEWLTGPSRYFAVGPSIRWLVFDAGQVRDEALVERARTDAAAAAYRRTVLAALGETETALVTYGRSRLERAALEREVTAASEAERLARRLYDSGLADFLTVLDAERTQHAAETSLALAEQETSDSFIALVKALGGGWPSASGQEEGP